MIGDPAIPEAHVAHKRQSNRAGAIDRRINQLITGSIAIRASILCIAIVSAVGCVTTETTDQTLPPYASATDDSSDPSSAPKPPPDPNQEGVLSTTADAL